MGNPSAIPFRSLRCFHHPRANAHTINILSYLKPCIIMMGFGFLFHARKTWSFSTLFSPTLFFARSSLCLGKTRELENAVVYFKETSSHHKQYRLNLNHRDSVPVRNLFIFGQLRACSLAKFGRERRHVSVFFCLFSYLFS